MLKSYPSDNLLLSIRQLSPSMLLLSLIAHGLVLLIPFPSSSKQKINDGNITQEQPILFSQSKSNQFFSDNKSLVEQKDLTSTPQPTNNPQFTAQLPSIPPDVTVQQLPIPSIQVTPTVAPREPSLNVSVSPEVSKQITDPVAAVVVAPITPSITPNPPIKQNPKRAVASKAKVKPSVVPSIRTEPVITTTAPEDDGTVPEPSSTQEEKETFDDIFIKLNEELSLSKEPHLSQPDFTATPGTENIYGTAIGKTPEEIAKVVKSKLEAQGFKASQVNTYAGGFVYTVTKNKFAQYITFTPNLEATGTVIITWFTTPVQLNKE